MVSVRSHPKAHSGTQWGYFNGKGNKTAKVIKKCKNSKSPLQTLEVSTLKDMNTTFSAVINDQCTCFFLSAASRVTNNIV